MNPRLPRAAIAVCLALLVAALVGPWVAPHGPAESVGAPYRPPGHGSLLGTDHLGRDLWSKLLHGGRSVVALPLAATAASTLIGAVLGALTASRRVASRALQRSLDVVVVIPPLLVLLLLLYGVDDRAAALVAAIVVVSVPFVARFTRAVATPVLASGYVEQAVALGESRAVVLLREVAPNLVGPVLADAGTRFVGAVYLAAAAGFLGFGAGAGDWGALIAANIEGAPLNPWGVVAPCLALAGLTASANLVADGFARRLS